MKYIYILLFALSSFFSNKSLYAEETYNKLAFFMPDDAMQENMYIPSAYQNNNYQIPSYTPPQKETATQQRPQKKQQKKAQKTKQAPKKSHQIIRKNLINEQATQKNTSNTQEQTKSAPVVIKEAQSQPTQNTETTDFSAFDFDENIQIKTETPKKTPKPNKTKKLSQLEKLRQKDVSDILYSIPYPDTTQPKYKQIYNIYAISLRNLYRQHELPYNYDQEISLEKANSLQKFEVK